MGNAPDNKPESSTFAVIPQIYFDVIARIIPGAISIGLYEFNYISQSLTTFGFAILCSYFIGMILHIFSIKIYALIFPNPKQEPTNWFKNYSDTPIWEWIRHTVKQSDRDVYVKIMAEKALFRNMALVALITIFYPPPFLVMAFGCFISRAICAVALIILCICTMTIHKWICQNQKDYDKQNNESEN